MLKLLAIYPALDQRAEMLYPLKELSCNGVETIVIAGQSMHLHGMGYSKRFESYDSLKVFRPYRDLNEMFFFKKRYYNEIFRLVRKFNPDVILSSQEMTMPLAVSLAIPLKIPIVLWVESSLWDLSRGKLGYKMKVPFSIKLSLAGLPPTILAYWNWLTQKSEAIITCSPADKPFLNQLQAVSGKQIEYIPWPIGWNMEEAESLRTLDKKSYGIYAGSLLKMKNIEEFNQTLPQILDNTSTEKFLIIGHGPEEKVIIRLRQRYGDRIVYVRDLPKTEVIKLIAKAKYAYTPATKLGSWQFIADCWALGTPLITNHKNDYITNLENGLAIDPSVIAPTINNLFTNNELYRRLVNGGYLTANDRHPKKIAMSLFSVLKRALK